MYENLSDDQKFKLIEVMYIQKVALNPKEKIAHPSTYDVELWKRYFFLCAVNDALVQHTPWNTKSKKEKRIHFLAMELYALAKENYIKQGGISFEKINAKFTELENFKRKVFKLSKFQKLVISDLYYSYIANKEISNPDVKLSEYNFIAMSLLGYHKYASSMKSMKKSYIFRVNGAIISFLAISLSVVGIVVAFK